MREVKELHWVGSQKTFFDEPDIVKVGNVVVGRYGGNSHAGQYKNEDGCLVWCNDEEEWEFTIVLDAHNTAESAEIVVEAFLTEKAAILEILALAVDENIFKKLEQKVVAIFQSDEFLEKCRTCIGETAVLVVFRKDKYVWWFSVGDCVLYLFHQELVDLGQYALNQRQFYQWVGQVNTFEEAVACYSTGTSELRKGVNRIFVTTDGLLECPGEPFGRAEDMYDTFLHSSEGAEAVKSMFDRIIENNVRDSTTVVSWEVDVKKAGTLASNQ